MATRAKYTRVNAPEEKGETKLDTDILMRFSESYGTSSLTQAGTSREPLLSFSERVNPLSPSRLRSDLWTAHCGSLRL